MATPIHIREQSQLPPVEIVYESNGSPLNGPVEIINPEARVTIKGPLKAQSMLIYAKAVEVLNDVEVEKALIICENITFLKGKRISFQDLQEYTGSRSEISTDGSMILNRGGTYHTMMDSTRNLHGKLPTEKDIIQKLIQDFRVQNEAEEKTSH